MAGNLQQFANQPGRQLHARAEAGFDYSRGSGTEQAVRQSEPAEYKEPKDRRMITMDIQPVLDADGKLANGGKNGSHDVHMLVDIREQGGDTARGYYTVAELQTHADPVRGRSQEPAPVHDVKYYQVPVDVDRATLKAGTLKDMGFQEMDEAKALGQMKQERETLNIHAREESTKIAVYGEKEYAALDQAKWAEQREMISRHGDTSALRDIDVQMRDAVEHSQERYEKYLNGVQDFAKGRLEASHMVEDAGARAQHHKDELHQPEDKYQAKTLEDSVGVQRQAGSGAAARATASTGFEAGSGAAAGGGVAAEAGAAAGGTASGRSAGDAAIAAAMSQYQPNGPDRSNQLSDDLTK